MILEHCSIRVRWGSKPRASGDDPGYGECAAHFFGVNPARAGMIPMLLYSAIESDRKPRASGDDPPSGHDGP